MVSRLAMRDEYVPIPGEWQCSVGHTTRCWATRNTCYGCGYPRGADRVVSEAPSPGFAVGPLGRVAATRDSPVNPSHRVSTLGAGVGSFSGGKEMALVVAIPKPQEVLLKFPLWEARP